MSILDDILQAKRQEVAHGKRRAPAGRLQRDIRGMPPARPFAGSLRAAGRCGIIAEIKRASPSRGLLRETFRPAWLAAEYEAGGARCLSVLTDRDFFKGAPEHLREARTASGLPALRKDFCIDPWQALESRRMGADCILIILAAVDDVCAAELRDTARECGMDSLFEVHDSREADRALDLDADLVGVNNRDLTTFRTDLAVFESLAAGLEGRLLVAESGIRHPADLARMRRAGADACLVGESLVTAERPSAALRTLLGGESRRADSCPD